MSYLALYRKYRPKTFDDFYGQKYIVNIIKNSIIENKISHAYLFSGPRGTGKTSMAKLIAKIVNCSDFDGNNACDKCDSCLLINDKSNPDIIEIDAASNNGVDEIRALREKVSLVPSVSKFKVYIIDEVHMLTMNAFNALLKTLEEPPSHVIFILATTELYKVPETIVSRCQCYEFERISDSEIVNCLKNIVKKEKFNIDDDVFSLIASYCKGGLRDAIGILDKLSLCSDEITTDLFYDIVGVVSEKTLSNIVYYIYNDKKNELMNLLDYLSKSGKNMSFLIEQLMEFEKNSIISGNSSDADLVLLKGLNDILGSLRFSSNYLLTIEVGFLQIVNKLFSNKEIISREIINNNYTNSTNVNNEEYSTKDLSNSSSDTNNINNDNDNDQNSSDIKTAKLNEHKHIFDITINNAFALAKKNIKIDMLNKWKDFNNYVHNKEFSSLVSYFLDGDLEVSGEKDVIISVNNDAIVLNASNVLVKLELLFNLVMGKDYNLAFVSKDDFSTLKNEYINNIKSGKKYKYIEKNDKIDDIIKNESTADIVNDSLESAKSIFGSDIVEIS